MIQGGRLSCPAVVMVRSCPYKAVWAGGAKEVRWNRIFRKGVPSMLTERPKPTVWQEWLGVSRPRTYSEVCRFLAPFGGSGERRERSRLARLESHEMSKKPNYRHERAQKTRAREAKQQEKQRRREEISTNRKSAQGEISSSEPAAPPASSDADDLRLHTAG